MIAITPQMRVLVAVEPVDFRVGIDGLAQRCRAVLHEATSGHKHFPFAPLRHLAVQLSSAGATLTEPWVSSGSLAAFYP
ncbi:MAG: hypothetical protein M0Z85_02945 [Gammaproteobacteria bacterium]|nr:hypothetical protein [Gammaproteobacteria bacterium]